MKLIIPFILFSLTACTTEQPEQPEQFVPSEQRVIVPGCEELKVRINEWNTEHPDQPRQADC